MSAAHLAARTPSRLTAWIVAFAAVPAALLVSGLAVAGGSYAAFSAKVSNPTSNWTTGTVAITDDDGGSAAFTATNLKPGSTGEKCIAVTSSGSLASVVKLYSTAAVTGTLGPYINLTVQVGTGGGFTAGCANFVAATNGSLYSGTLSAFSTAYTSYANGLGTTWSPTGGSAGSETKVFRLAYTVDANTPSTFQNTTAGLGFTWETQNS